MSSSAEKYAVDASVVVRWIIRGEEWENQALKLRNRYANGEIELYSPHLLTFEVLNSIWKAALRGYLELVDALLLCDKFSILMPNFLDFTSSEDLKEIEKIAIENAITAYDSSYILVSIKIGSPLIVADSKLFEKIKDKFQIVHLKDI